MGLEESKAIPLVLPNDYTWDEQTETCRKKWLGIKRTGLSIIPYALYRLRRIKGPVCVVSVAGPQRKGKSFILSKVFDQGEVFPLGHSMIPETMGIWLWVVPQKFKDSTGREFTVVLLDSEGTDSPNAKQEDDYRIFTLSYLLSSILIYNSTGVANRSDLEKLDFILKLSKRINMHAFKNQKAFPIFIWLLRDVVLRLPPGCATLKDYFLKNVLNVNEAGSSGATKEGSSILNFFSGFDAFSLPSPSVDAKVVENLNDQSLEDQVNPKFLEGIEEFKAILHPKLAPKKSINEGEFVTGEALATMVEQFVKALNTPGAVPNVKCAWETFVCKKCNDALEEAIDIYNREMTSRMKDKIPCEDDVIREEHGKSMDFGLETFRRETSALSRKSVVNYKHDLREKTNVTLSEWRQQNSRETEAYCTRIFKELKQAILDPVLNRLSSPEGFKMQFSDIGNACSEIENRYKANARGAKDVQDTVFMKLRTELENEREEKINILQRMKTYNKSLERQKAEAARQKRKEAEFQEEIARLRREKENREIQMALLRQQQEEEKKRHQQMLERRMASQIKIISGREEHITANKVEISQYQKIIRQEGSNCFLYSQRSYFRSQTYSSSQASPSCSYTHDPSDSDSDSKSDSCHIQ